jgi:hypothetical protein
VTGPIALFDNGGVQRAVLNRHPDHIITTGIPEPSTLVLLGSGLVVLGAMARRVRRK